MGLDMYLIRKVYVGAKYEHRKVEGIVEITINTGTKHEKKLDIDFSKISYIEEMAGYWRKANAIHAWFVENIQEGNDNCGTYYVDKEQLEELNQLCLRVLANSKLTKGVVQNGTKWTPGDDEPKPMFESGEFIEDASVAHELLPTTEGFFFGSTDYDQWYYQDIQDTVEILKPILARENDEAEYYYHSSW